MTDVARQIVVSQNGPLKMFVDLTSQKSFLCRERRHILGGEVELQSFKPLETVD